jgi:tetratricopeptide (TPR) repeat protein
MKAGCQAYVRKAFPIVGEDMYPPGSGVKKILAGLALFLLVLAVFWPVQHYDFINYDDSLYVQDNPRLEEGLTAKSIQWMLTATDGGSWHPVTWLSLFLDYRLYGPAPGGYHRTNMLIHAISTVLLFLVLSSMTGSLWKSALVAALFGIHPLHVESVAWIAERKDVLCGLFWMLTMGSYLWYARKPETVRYLAVCCFFLLGLTSKAMIVTLPFLLLLIDFHPLRRVAGSGPPPEPPSRWKQSTLSALILEKAPLILLAAAAGAAAVWSQEKSGALVPIDTYGFDSRLANAVVSYGTYLVKTLWPKDLSVFYPLPAAWPVGDILASGFVLVGISLGALFGWRRYPYLAMGWLWYLGTLIPVIGLVHIGSQAMADRYTYLPLIGVFVILVWGGADLAAAFRLRRPLLLILSAALVLVPSALSARQVQVWRNDWTLFSQAVRAVPNNYLAYNNLGTTLRKQGNFDASIAAIRKALFIRPHYAEGYNNLGNTLMATGAHAEAAVQYRRALEFKPEMAQAHSNLANSLIALGKTEEALEHYRTALKIDPSFAEAHYNLGIALVKQGRIDDGVLHLERSVSLRPNSADAWNNLGVAQALKGKGKEAAASIRRALLLNPDHLEAKKNLSALGVETEHAP